MTECAVWWSEPLSGNEFRPLLDPVEQDRFTAYRRSADQRRFLTGRAMAKTIVAERLGLSPSAIRFDSTCDDCGKPHGRPRLPGSTLQLSISHSGDRVGLAVTDGVPVGLDVERAGRDVAPTLVDYALNSAESVALKGLSADELAGAFFTFWTRKEAVIKATGKGLRIPLHSITLSAPSEPAGLLDSTTSELSTSDTRMADLHPGEGYHGALALLTTTEPVVTEHWWHP